MAGSYEYGDKLSGSGATKLVSYVITKSRLDINM
jgi:hypothetical protein